MSEPVQLDVCFALVFDHALFVEERLLGTVRHIGINTLGPGRLEFPRDVLSNQSLQPPVSATDTLTGHLPNSCWGIRAEASPNISIEAVLIIVSITTHLDFDLSKNQIGGAGIRKTVQTVSEWFDSFSQWIWVLTSQSLNPMNPDPKVVYRRSRNIFITASSEGKSSLPSSVSPTLRATVCFEGPSCERLVNEAVLDMALQQSGNRPPLIFELLASARMATRRGDKRRALVDAGTAAEAALARAMRLSPSHEFTLGELVYEAQNWGLDIPADTIEALVEPRNDAVHRGRVATTANVDRALDIAEDLAMLGKPNLIPVASLTPVNRPQAHNIVLIKGPVQDSSESK